MNIKCDKMQIRRTAHVFSAGDLDSAENLWLICHGYGQKADNLLRKFEGVDLTKNLLLAPEAISKFYWNGFSGEPVASWMTSRHRFDEIHDYCDYLDQLLNSWLEKRKFEKIILFGFSQGCASLWRWVHSRKPGFHIFINWAGNIPEDISYLDLQKYLTTKHLYMVYGNSDPYITNERLKDIRNTIVDNKLNFRFKTFKGGHSLHQLPLENIINEIIE